MDSIYDPSNLILDRYNCTEWFREKHEESADTPLIPPPKGDKEKPKSIKGIKILTPNKLLIRLPVLLARIKAGHN